MPDPLMAIVKALTEERREKIERDFTAVNRHWTGATTADILEALVSSDSDLDKCEPFWEEHGDEFDVAGASEAARALIWSGQELTVENMLALLGAAGLLED